MSLVAYVDHNLCDQSPMCPAKRACPKGAISQHTSGCSFCAGGLSVVDKELCTGCGICMKNCPGKAIKMIPKK